MEVPSAMKDAGNEFAAEENHDQVKLEKKLEQLEGGAAPGAPGAGASDAAPAAESAALVAVPDDSTVKLCRQALEFVDKLVVGFTAPELKLSEEELTKLSTAAVPVFHKFAPDLVQKLATTVEGQFVLVVAMIYASKVPALLAAPKKAPATKQPEKAADAAPSSPAEVAKAA